MIALFFLYQTFGGGSTSFTVHLYEGMRRAGLNPQIFRVKERGETFTRPFTKYDGVRYRNVTVQEALKIAKHNPSLLVAPCHSKHLKFCPDLIHRLMKAGMRIVVHDPNEFEVYDHLTDRNKVKRPICIRPTMKQFFPDAVFIPHPYVREFSNSNVPLHIERPWNAVSIARITFVKRTDMIIEANARLPARKRVVLRGAENRLFTRFKILPKFPDFKQGIYGFPMTWGASARECAKAKFAVDLTYFPNDGGGSQYSFMEAWDAGTINIIHEDWLRFKGEMKANKNCLTISSVDDLVKILKESLHPDKVYELISCGYKALSIHDAEVIAQQYAEELNQ